QRLAWSEESRGRPGAIRRRPRRSNPRSVRRQRGLVGGAAGAAGASGRGVDCGVVVSGSLPWPALPPRPLCEPVPEEPAVAGARTISTRRFCARPSAVALLAIGDDFPFPTEWIRSAGTPWEVK